jgi:peroxiredoxin
MHFCLVLSLLMGLSCFPAWSADKELPNSSKVTIGGEDGSVDSEIELNIGDPAPDFTLPNLSTDKMESLKDYLGKPVIVFFIQSACYSCLQEAKALKTLKEKYSGLEVIAIGVDLLGKPMLVSWAAHNKLNYPVLLDPIFAVPEKYGFSYTPSSVIVDQKGKIAFIHSGFRASDMDAFESKVKELLGTQ